MSKREDKPVFIHVMEPYMVSEGTALLIINLGVGWRWVVSLTTRPLYSGRKTPL